MQKLLTLVVLLSFVCFGSALKIIDNNVNKTLACCGASTSYDVEKQICCINSVFPIPAAGSNLQAVCCGNRLLTTTQQCCSAVAGSVSSNDRAIDATATCCGTNALTNPATQACCAGTVVSNPNGLTQCCGSRLFDSSVDVCCGTTLVSNGAGRTCCGNTALTTGQQCCNGAVAPANNGQQCCGTSSFNPATQTCCAGTVSSGASASCCGTRGYNPSTQICCGNENVLSNANSNLQCCGPSKTFDPSTQTCCTTSKDNFVKTGEDANGCAIYTNEPIINYNVGSVANGQCCDGVAYNPATSICCIDRVITNPNNRQCCGTNLYDPSTDVCCPQPDIDGARVFSGRAADGLQCCLDNTFNPLTQACPCGVVINIADDLSQNNNNPNVVAGCCGSTQYDANERTCCVGSNSLFNLDPAAGLSCCPQDGKTIYNPGYQVCCDKKDECPGKPSSAPVGVVNPKSATVSPSQNKKLVQCGDSCCKGKGYFSSFQFCCDGEIVDYNNDLAGAATSPLACCGKTIFNHFYESCCEEDLGNGVVNTAVYGGPGNWQLCCKA